jgi:WD40 repeat protein
LAIFADGRRAVSCAALASDLRTWDLERNKCVWQKRDFDHFPSFVDISADGRLILSAGRGCRLWDFASAKLLSQIDDVHGPAALSGDGRTAVAVVEGKTPRLWVWEVDTGIAQWTLGGFVVKISGLAIDHGGAHIAITDHDGIRIFDLSQRKLLWEKAEPPAPYRSYPYSNPTFSGDGKRLAACRSGGHVEVWDTAQGALLSYVGSGQHGCPRP